MANNQNKKGNRPNYFQKKKFCWFCKHNMWYIDYKDPNLLKNYIHENGKIMSRRLTGTCHYHQKRLTIAIKRARHMALLPFIVK